MNEGADRKNNNLSNELEWRLFQKDEQFLYPDAEERSYTQDKSNRNLAIHWGQRKLALTILQFLNLYWNSDTRPTIVYAGAAGGANINFLAKLFPEAEWHLYDPSKFAITRSNNIKINTGESGLFTDETAKQWGEAVKEGRVVLFISDIRNLGIESGNINKNNRQTIEREIWNDMKTQQRWVNLIKPHAASLKFRLPYPYSDIQFDNDIEPGTETVPYLSGILYLQPYGGVTSTESRLVVIPDENNQLLSSNWNLKNYESQMFYHNTVTRERIRYYNPIAEDENIDSKDPIDNLSSNPELVNRWDDLTEYSILNDYLITRGVKDRHEKILALSKILTGDISPTTQEINLNLLRRNPNYIKISKGKSKGKGKRRR